MLLEEFLNTYVKDGYKTVRYDNTTQQAIEIINMIGDEYDIVVECDEIICKVNIAEFIKSKVISAVYGDWGKVHLVLNHRTIHTFVDFCALPTNRKVSYDELIENSCSLNPSLYYYPTLKEGQKYVLLGDLVEIDNGTTDFPRNIKIPYYSTTKNFNKIASGYYLPDFEYYNDSLSTRVFFGPHLHLSYDIWRRTAGVREFITSKDSHYFCGTGSWGLKPISDEVSLEYLALVLLTDKTFDHFMSYNSSLSGKMLLSRKIVIDTKKDIQKEMVKKAIAAGRDVVNSNMSYNIVWIDSEITEDKFEDIRLKLVEWKIRILHRTSSVYSGKYSAKDLLTDTDLKRSIHAVIIDPKTDSVSNRYKGFQRVINICRNQEIPVYVYTDADINLIKEDLEEDDYTYCHKNFFSKEACESLKFMITALRDELDLGSSERMFLSEYTNEYYAAQWIDSNVSLSNRNEPYQFSVLKTMTDLYMYNESVDIRNTAHRIVQLMRNYKIVPASLDEGAAARLLRDQTYSNSKDGMIYSLLPEHPVPHLISRYLDFVISETNKINHGNLINRGNLNKIFMLALLDCLNWVYHCFVKDIQIDKHHIYFTVSNRCEVDFNGGLVEKDDNDAYYFMGNVHIHPKNNVKEGDLVDTSNCKVVEEKRPCVKFVNGRSRDIFYFAKNVNVL